MTIDTNTVTPTTNKAQGGLLTRGKGFLKVLAVLFLVAAVTAWVSLGVGLYMDVDRGARLTLAIVAALATEALFWTVAALLGVSVVEARKRIWRRITGVFTGPSASREV